MKVIKNLATVIAILLGILCLTALVLLLFGYRPYILSTNSMEPMYMQGSLCLIDTTVSLDNLEAGDTLVYRSPANSLVLHRLVEITSTGEDSLSVVMQGDASEFIQNVELSKINYIGREAFTIPRLGALIDGFQPVAWVVVIVFLVLACIPWDSIYRKCDMIRKEVMPT